MCPHTSDIAGDGSRAGACSFCRPSFDDLGVCLHDGGGTLRVWSGNATAIDVVFFDRDDVDWVVDRVALQPVGDGVWEVSSALFVAGARYGLHVTGPGGGGNAFDPGALLLDPYARGLVRAGTVEHVDHFRSVVVDGSFDWGGAKKPRTSFADTVIYEAHVKGLTKRHPQVPPALHGTYAGVAHPAMIEHYQSLGVTAVELLPVHAFMSEPWLAQNGRVNYWGYNTVGFFAPHVPYATQEARRGGPDAVLREFKGMVRLLHEAGIEVILDVVYNHTAEGGPGGPVQSLRGLDNARYYRHADDGSYVDTTACGNTIDTSTDAAARLILDSLRYWADDVQVDGFRFDLATALGRDAQHTFTAQHPLLQAIESDPVLQETKLIAEPWDIGLGGWQTGNFGERWHEWNDRYRDRVRNFWLSDIDYARRASTSPVGIGGFATRLAGSSNTFSAERGPLASINFVTAHDGFTLRDLVSYNVKHNEANGEDNRDGAETNRAFNHGTEGPTNDPVIEATRRKAMRNLVGTLLLSAGVPMLTAGDEVGRTQGGNNNAYCHDSALTWFDWEWEPWQENLREHVSMLTRLRRENRALRPVHFARLGEQTPGATLMEWFDHEGDTMSIEQWNDAAHRTLQYLAVAEAEDNPNRVLLIVHGVERAVDVRLPRADDVSQYVSLWSSADETPHTRHTVHAAGDTVAMPGTSMHLFRAE
ncbi:glycogen debranching protein GlgX [Microbacterium sp. YY-01]|uniref:glycogen debranching protein GlgX n=1 Tax=Microbacterium sp. YY-01 TaxID=3421634 RepID=UPI003D17BFD6